MTKDSSTLVLPGGETRCIFSYSTPFAFQVIPGDTDKLLFYFQGGGACWDEYSTKAGLCTTDVAPQSPVGVFDRSNSENRFKDFTIVHVIYCSGDVHGGNTIRSYNDAQGVPVQQKGLANAQSALDWVNQEVKAGHLASTFSDVVVMGCSAGSIGAQLWAQQVLNSLSYTRAAVVPDSYAGVFPPGSEGPLIYDFGLCTASFLSDDLRAKCLNQTLEVTDVNLASQSALKAIPFVFLQSKVDIVQQSFYISVGVTMNSSSKTITPTEFYNDVNTIFGGYNAASKNFLTYLIDGDHHCFTDQAIYYTTDPISDVDNGKQSSSALLTDYVDNLPLQENQSLDTVCDGSVKVFSDSFGSNGKKSLRAGADNTYCSSQLVPKTFTEHY
eukprot:scaffold633_cov288-Ochromonas_danica.AAC.14